MAISDFFYVFVDDVEDFAMARAPRNPELDKRVRAGAGWISDWQPLHFTLEEGTIVTDYLANSFAFRLCSERLRDVIDRNRSKDDEVQWLAAPVKARDGVDLLYWVLHFPNDVDVLNASRTLISGPVIVKAYLDPNRVANHRVMSLPRDSVSLIVADQVKRAVQTAGSTGMKFSRVPFA